MPDAHGNIKGIALSVSEEKWARIFGPTPAFEWDDQATHERLHREFQANRDNNSDPR